MSDENVIDLYGLALDRHRVSKTDDVWYSCLANRPRHASDQVVSTLVHRRALVQHPNRLRCRLLYLLFGSHYSRSGEEETDNEEKNKPHRRGAKVSHGPPAISKVTRVHRQEGDASVAAFELLNSLRLKQSKTGSLRYSVGLRFDSIISIPCNEFSHPRRPIGAKYSVLGTPHNQLVYLHGLLAPDFFPPPVEASKREVGALRINCGVWPDPNGQIRR